MSFCQNTYNNLGYPTSTHESTYDADGVWYIPGETVTQGRQIEYIKND
ncbi:MAG TPA: hypothetical protein VKT28_14595 [Puia sp.]|nr:hypothetical protein [Puia sp.]